MEREGVEPDGVAYSALVTVLGKSQQWERAVSVFYEMVTRGIEPDARAYASLVLACRKVGSVAGTWAAEVVDALKERGVWSAQDGAAADWEA